MLHPTHLCLLQLPLHFGLFLLLLLELFPVLPLRISRPGFAQVALRQAVELQVSLEHSLLDSAHLELQLVHRPLECPLELGD